MFCKTNILWNDQYMHSKVRTERHKDDELKLNLWKLIMVLPALSF